MKKYIITLFVSLMAVFSYGQSVYMHEAQEEAADSSNDGNLLYGLLGLGVLFLLVKIIGLIFKCLAENKKKREDIFKRLEQETLNQKIKESYRIEKLNKNFDFIFIDAAKAQYRRFFDKYCIHLNENGIIVSDNMNFHGLVEHPELSRNRNTRQLVRKIHDYHTYLAELSNYETAFYDYGDGVAITRRK